MDVLKLAVFTLPLAVAGCSPLAIAGNCRFEAPREATISVQGASKVQVVARAGSLSIGGKPGLDAVRAEGTACADSQAKLERIRLIAERRGDVVWIESVFDDDIWNNGSLSFTVELLDSLPLEVKDGSGAAEIRDVASLDVEDGSGELEIENVAGAVKIDDGSGSLRMQHAGGPVTIDDGSGTVEIEDVNGDVELQDGSGSITARRVTGNVRLRDGSGGIDVEDIEGDFVVARDGSGGVEYHNVSGRVDIPRR